ncbi:protoporphyrinogen oxidase [Pseudobythopirellula maris]|nr:protoporphyrinogen oxidase [Pseudobythopirellula maris]
MDSPSTESRRPKRIAVVGGGVGGLAAALRLSQATPAVDWRLLEASPRLGGVLSTVRKGDWLVEESADNFLTKLPWARDLCDACGIGDELLPTDESRRRAMVVCRGRLAGVPRGFVVMSPRELGPILASPVLSWRGRMRLAIEPLVPRGHKAGDESVASFARRRLGREAYERLVQPLLSGIYTADAERLSMAATMPQLIEQEAEYGSLYRAARHDTNSVNAGESGARYGLFLAPRNGMEQMVQSVADRLPRDRVRTNARVASATLGEAGFAPWRLTDERGEALGEYDGLVLATPAPHAASVLRGINPELAGELGAISYAGVAIVCLGVDKEQVRRPLEGFGFVAPAIEGRRLIAASFASLKFPGRAPDGKLLVRAFIGGALQPELLGLDDDQLIKLAKEELGDLIGLQGEPELTHIARWPGAMPQYHVGHTDRIERIENATAAMPALALAGAAYRGVGIPQCVRSGELAAERVLGGLGPQS